MVTSMSAVIHRRYAALLPFGGYDLFDQVDFDGPSGSHFSR
jgi:hypothetical protein